jgi:hypothetical protein
MVVGCQFQNYFIYIAAVDVIAGRNQRKHRENHRPVANPLQTFIIKSVIKCILQRVSIKFATWATIGMVAHLDAVTSLAIDPSGLYLLSGSKYIVLLC